MNQETRINKIINESLQAFEHLCLENEVNRVRTGGCRYLHECLSDNVFSLKHNATKYGREIMLKLDSQCGFAVHRILRKRVLKNSNRVPAIGRFRQGKRFWRMILVDHIRSSGVSIRTGYSAESGPWQSGHGVIRIVPYQTENQLLKALLNAFSHQVLHYDTGRATSSPIWPKSLHRAEALALSYVVARSIGLESLFHDDVIKYSLLHADEIDWQFRQRIRIAAFALLTNLHSSDSIGKYPRESESMN